MHESLCEIPAMANMAVETLSHVYKLAKGMRPFSYLFCDANLRPPTT